MSSALSNNLSAFSLRDCINLYLLSIGQALYISNKSPYCSISETALLGPMPAIPGTLSPVSPARHLSVRYLSGSTS